MSCQKVYANKYIDNATGSRNYWSDRDVNDQLQLPHELIDIKIKPNELITTKSINASLDKLYDNLLYIVAKSRVPQSLLPDVLNYNNVISTVEAGVEGLSAIEWKDNTTTSYSSSKLSEMTTGLFVKNDDADDMSPDRGVIFTLAGDESTMTMLSQVPGGGETLSVTNRVDSHTNRTFTDQVNKCIISGEKLYISMIGSDQVIYVYDAIGLLKRDESFFAEKANNHGKTLITTIGSPGKVGETTRFSNIVSMTSDYNHNIYVLDSSEAAAALKIFDKNSNFVKHVDISTHVQDRQLLDMCFANNQFLILTDQSVIILTLELVHVKTVEFQDSLVADEHYKFITPSADDRNVVYVATNKRVFKKFTTRLDGGIGNFYFSGRNSRQMNSDIMDIVFVSATSTETGEHVYVGDKSRGVVHVFTESMDYQEMMHSSWEQSFISLNDILIKPEEYVNYIVYNKSLAKMFYNHAILGNNIRRKLVCTYDGLNNLEFKATRYLLPQNIRSRKIPFGLKNMIGANEVLMNTVVNRTLNHLYNIQQNILLDLDIEVADSTRNPPVLTSAAV